MTSSALVLGTEQLARTSFVILGFGALAAAYVISVAIQPVVCRLAIAHNFLDRPDGERRGHAEPIPRLGGVGVFVATLAAVAIALSIGSVDPLANMLSLTLMTVFGATILFVVGLVDDLVGVRPVVKLAVQSSAAVIAFRFGFSVTDVVLPTGTTLSLGFYALPVTVLWIVGLSNAFNLVDGADGLAGGVAVIALVGTAISALVLNHAPAFVACLALTGAMIGFLRFNLPPARMFLGDSGSLVVGFFLAILTVKGMSRADGAVYAVGPIFVLCYPLLDTGISMLRRWLRGDPLSRADGRHIHHQLQALGLGPRQMLLVIYGLSALVATLGLLASFASVRTALSIALLGGAVLCFVMVYGARWLQYHEFLEAGASLTSVLLTGRERLQDKIYARELARIISTARTAAEVGSIIRDNAHTFRFEHMQLRWGSSRKTPPERVAKEAQESLLLTFDYPVRDHNRPLGPLFVSVWCHVDTKHFGAIRILEILAPAITLWMEGHAGLLAHDCFDEPTSHVVVDSVRATPGILPLTRRNARADRRVQRDSADAM